MNLRLIAVGKLRTPYISQACAEFRKRLTPYFPYEETEVRAADGATPALAVREESDRILRLLRPDEPVWLLEREGKAIDSASVSRNLGAVAASGARRLTLIVAGTYGADERLRARATFLWSLSPLTFLHEWARAIVLEQLYRAAKIARNEPYHH